MGKWSKPRPSNEERELVKVMGSLLRSMLIDIQEQSNTLSSDLDRLDHAGVEVAYLYREIGIDQKVEKQKNAKTNSNRSVRRA